MLDKVSILDGRIAPTWMSSFESHRFGVAEAEGFIRETLPILAETLGGESFVTVPTNYQGTPRKILVITPPPQKSFREVFRVIRQDLWLNRMFVGIDDRGRWTFEVPS